ncbi:L-threonine synthase [Ferrimonas balearica DSM 9799]|uniref:Threonine synthase n=1 Tax=Ferrimonas balearica (strain DSM 9799 / CCM 4581 / KCTC 23876 / PAT) TaxID=550540 RepID=E1SSD9_FERBD|nr:threonine synthase [Ferrimonas balearica]ADN74979.1 L-threonine synthase [Ferrimonas balearica DSM 9799]
MQLYNLKQPDERVNFAEAVKRGLGQQQGLFFPEAIPALKLDEAFWQASFVERAERVLGALLAEELGQDNVSALVRDAFNFELPLVPATAHQYCLELFHGPTLAFKDFGARFLARTLSLVARDTPMTILTATSGDTGAAVADAFYGLPNIRVVVLYPDGGISELQEKLFCTLGDNIHTVAVKGSFDDCQAMVKAAFSDAALKAEYGLTSANSINIARLLAQVVYYFEALAQLPEAERDNAVFAVPSGNFGNLTAGLLAKAMGAPIKRFVAATNSNDTVPRYLNSGQWQPGPVHATLSNAMDVTSPNNWPRVEALFAAQQWPLAQLAAERVSEPQTEARMVALNGEGYLSEPHAAVASEALERQLAEDEVGIFLGTAHPAKFQGAVEQVLNIELPLPPALAAVQDKPILSSQLAADADALKQYLRQRL